MQKKLLSIIIPTRERPDTLKHCLRTVLMQEDDRYEVIVSDNCSGPETKEVVNSFRSEKIKYIRPENRLGMSENFEFALQHIKGDWVTIIGDDDGLLPNAVSRFFEILGDTDVRVVSSLPCGFEWPSLSEDALARLLVLSNLKQKKVEMRRSKDCLNKVVRDGHEYKDLPCLYNGGFMRADLINEIRNESAGEFYKAINPDIYSGIAACSKEKDFLYIWEPLVIGGASHHSNGIQWAKKSSAETKNMAFSQENKKSFHPSLGSGLAPSLSLHVYDSYLQSSHLRNFEVDTNLTKQLALSLLTAPSKRKQDAITYCQEVCLANGLDYNNIIAATKLLKVKRKIAKLKKKLHKIFPTTTSVKKQVVTNDDSLQTIYDASIRLGEMLKL